MGELMDLIKMSLGHQPAIFYLLVLAAEQNKGGNWTGKWVEQR